MHQFVVYGINRTREASEEFLTEHDRVDPTQLPGCHFNSVMSAERLFSSKESIWCKRRDTLNLPVLGHHSFASDI